MSEVHLQVEDMSRWQELVQEQRLQAERLAQLRVDAARQVRFRPRSTAFH
jgi:hypothetical protein